MEAAKLVSFKFGFCFVLTILRYFNMGINTLSNLHSYWNKLKTLKLIK